MCNNRDGQAKSVERSTHAVSDAVEASTMVRANSVVVDADAKLPGRS